MTAAPRPATPGSLRELRGLAADAHAAWVRGACLTAALAYTAIPLFGFVTAGLRFPRVLTEVGALFGALVALWLERRGRTMEGGILIGLVFFLELHASLLLVGGFPLQVVLGLPLMVAALGVLFGGPAGIAAAAVTSVTAPAAAWVGAWLQGRGAGPPAPPFVLFVLAAVLTASAVLVHLGLKVFGRATMAALEGQQRASQLGRIVEETDTEVFVVDSETAAFVIVSRGARENLGYSAEELGRLTWQDVNGGWRPDPHETRPDAATSSRRLPAGRGVHRRKDGSAYPVELQIQRDELRGRAIDVVFAIDVSARVAAEKEQARLQLQLQHAQKMEAIGQLAGGVAHDFNNLLMVIGGFAEILCENVNEDVRELAGEILRAQARGATLTRQLLAFARKDVVQPRLWDPGDVVREIEPLLKRLVGEPVDLAIDERPSRPLWVDRGQFEQTVINLVANSRDALTGPGRIAISIGDAAGLGSGQPEVRVSVADDGHGMDEATRLRIFEPFFTTKPRNKGTGLGLAVVHGIVSQHGGRVEVDSTPGRGTTVSMFWPAAPADLQTDLDPPDVVVAPESSRSGATVLVADDDDGARAFLRRVLERAGYRVVDACDGARALAAARAHRDAIDLVLTDVVMPGLSGFELADRFRLEFPDTPVLFMSGYIDEGVAVPREGAARPDVVYKPFKTAELLALVGDTQRRGTRARRPDAAARAASL